MNIKNPIIEKEELLDLLAEAENEGYSFIVNGSDASLEFEYFGDKPRPYGLFLGSDNETLYFGHVKEARFNAYGNIELETSDKIYEVSIVKNHSLLALKFKGRIKELAEKYQKEVGAINLYELGCGQGLAEILVDLSEEMFGTAPDELPNNDENELMFDELINPLETKQIVEQYKNNQLK